MTIVIKIGIFFLNIVYFCFRIFPVREKIVFISRESNSPTVDIARLTERITKQHPTCEVKVLCKMIGDGLKGKLSYGFHMLKQMYHMSTAKVAVLDTYCIAASVLKHRSQLKVVQMWHAVGCLKKFSYSILDKTEGRSSKIANAMKMHHNYDYIFVSSEMCKEYLAEAYRCSVEQMQTMPLPRMDVLVQPEEIEKNARRIYEDYPELKGKETILYVPTFRKSGEQDEAISEFAGKIDLQKYNFVLKYHPIVKNGEPLQGIITDNKFSSLEWMSVSDYVVTDYSAVSYEAAVAGKPLFFYTYDWEEYEEGRSFYIDYETEMPGVISSEPEQIAQAIEHRQYDLNQVKKFAEKYIEKGVDYTGKAVEFLVGLL